MMRAIAEFIMRGRLPAALVAVLPLPIISSAAIALVTLRRGPVEGSLILILAVVPSLFYWVAGFGHAPEVLLNIGLLAAIYWGAVALRATGYWPWALIAVIAISAVSFAGYYLGFPSVAEQWQEVFGQIRSQQQMGSGDDLDPEAIAAGYQDNQFVSLLVLSLSISNVLSLVVGRWWQSILYNPGGFAKEFLALRLTPVQATLCLVVSAICLLTPEWQAWAGVVMLPLVIASVAMAHQFAARQGLGGFWLAVFYVALIFGPFRLAMVALSFFDSWFDLRSKLNSKPKKRDDEPDA